MGVAALLLGASQLLSRALGVVREMVLAYSAGAGASVDAYRAAFQLPDLMNHLLAVAAIATAFIPLYQRAKTRSGDAGAENLFATVWGTLTVTAVVATGFLFWFTPAFVAFYFPDFDGETRALTVKLTRIVLPAQICFVSGGILRAVLMAQGRFGAQALAPVLYNLGIIAGGLLGAHFAFTVGDVSVATVTNTTSVEGFAWGALGGAALGHLFAPLVFARGRVRLRMRVAFFDREFLRYLWLALPLLAGVTLVSADEWLDRWFGQFLGAGAIALLFYARALLQAPVGLLGQAVGTAALPALSVLLTRGRADEARALIERTLQVTLALGVFFAAALFVFAQPLVTLLYLRGAFTADDAHATAIILKCFAVGLPAWVLQSVAVRAFYARGDTWRPMWLGTIVTLGALPLYSYAALHSGFGARALALAGAVAISASAVATLLLARRLHGAPRAAPLALALARGVLLTAPGALLAHALLAQLNARAPVFTSATWNALAQLTVGGVAMLAVTAPLLYRFADAATRARLQIFWRIIQARTSFKQ